MTDSRSKAQRAFLALPHLLDDDQGAGDEIISNAGRVIEDFQRFFVLHFQLLKNFRCRGQGTPAGSPCSGTYFIAHQGEYLESAVFTRATQ